jgi:[CysO sulfur-carrier protein]-S-L-cysteine hydrolase
VLRLDRIAFDQLVAQAYDCYPEEACGLIAGPAGEHRALRFYPCRNAAASARVYTIDPGDHLRAERDADDHDWEINGVVHSHTHSEPYPSPTDVAQAPDPEWHYVIVSLKREVPEVRSYRIVGEVITEERIDLI